MALAICVVASALLAASFGQDAGFDLKNYHWYAGHQLVGGRLDLDIAAAQIQGYFNPLIHLPLWFGTQAFGGRFAAILLGALHGLGPFLAWKIARSILPESTSFATVGAAAACALVGFVGPIELASLGTSSGDALMPVFVLGGVLLLSAEGGPSPRAVVVSGLLVGAAVGLKPTVGMYGVGIAAALLIAPPTGDRRATVPWVLAAAAAWAVVAGPWMVNLLLRYGNPLFPLANHIFESPWAVVFSYSEDRLMPGTAWDAWTFPLAFARGGTSGWEVPFRDARVAVLVLAGAVGWWGASRRLRFLLLFCAISYVVWQLGSSVYRYLGVLELLAPALIFAAVVGSGPLRASRVAVGLAVVALLGAWVQVPALGRLPFSTAPGPPFGVVLPMSPPPGSVVLIAGSDALSYIAPAFDPAVRVLRPWSSLSTHTDPTEANRAIAALLAEPPVAVYLLEGPNPTVAPEVLAHYGLEVGDCGWVRTRLDGEVTLCELTSSRRPRGAE